MAYTPVTSVPLSTGGSVGLQSCTTSFVEMLSAPAAGYTNVITDIIVSSSTASDGGIVYLDDGTTEFLRIFVKTNDTKHISPNRPIRVGDGLAVRVKGDAATTHVMIIGYVDQA